VHVPCATSVTSPAGVTGHTDAVDDVNVGVRPLDADAIDATENAASPNVFATPV
jgi:hypothetical protein